MSGQQSFWFVSPMVANEPSPGTEATNVSVATDAISAI